MEEQINCRLSAEGKPSPARWSFPVILTGKALPALITLLILVTSRSVLHAEDNVYSAGSILLFTESLIAQGEYYRALTELRRLDSYYPGYLSTEQFMVTEYYIFYRSGRFNEILAAGDLLKSGCAEGIFIADSCIMLKDYSRCEPFLDEKNVACEDASLKEMYKKRRIYLGLITGSAYDNGVLKPEFTSFKELADYTSDMMNDKKSPLLAAFLGIIPGLGYVYAGESGTGAVAFTVTGICGAVSWASFSNGVEPVGIIAGAVALFFYGGNIAGGYMQTEKYNRKIDEHVDARLRTELDMNNDADKVYMKFGISSHGR